MISTIMNGKKAAEPAKAAAPAPKPAAEPIEEKNHFLKMNRLNSNIIMKRRFKSACIKRKS